MGAKIPNLMLSSGLVIALFGGFALSACNHVTGADKIFLYDTDDDDGSTSVDPAGGGGNTMAGGGAGAGDAGGAGTGGDPATTVANSSSQMASSTTGGPDPCVYPAGPYGVAQGQIVPPTLSWQVYAPGASSPSTLTSEDLFDCDGTKGIDVIVVDTSQYG